ncbi:MAG: hypothetical protein A2428_10030 [Bdellovibrionales bacterium RIFOXYC1_FULL_54_43]|nr:MAG: hypothetical protein A2428_10030 [Bdellovibrionales bacterium RIFOXYC1_FULL_54_43]OFZ80521.1 MAG: hypothetical protein A2603_13125 [Bdellovibrionales bacterium RIFOXYD1_FULL_55_31]
MTDGWRSIRIVSFCHGLGLVLLVISIFISRTLLAARPPAGIFCSIHANEGFELYSWKTNTGWHFSLRPGIVPSEKPTKIAAETQNVLSVHSLKKRLKSISKDKKICWRTNPDRGLVQPPASIVREIKETAKAQGLDLAERAPARIEATSINGMRWWSSR